MRASFVRAVLLAGISTWTNPAFGQLVDSPPVASFLRRSFVAGEQASPLVPLFQTLTNTATVLGDYVYVDGGEVSQLVDGLPPTGGRSSNTGTFPLFQELG